MAKLDTDIDVAEDDRWEGLARLFDDVVQDCWGRDPDDPTSLEIDPIDSTTGIYGEGAFANLVQEAIAAVRGLKPPRRPSSSSSLPLALVAVRIRDWDRLGDFLGDSDRGEVCKVIARQLEEQLRLDDDVGRTRPDTFALLLRGISKDELEALCRRCREAVESSSGEVYADSIQVRVACGFVIWEGERADRLLESAWRAADPD